MKSLVSLLSALLLISYAAGVYVQVPQQEIVSSALINQLLEFGLDYNFEKAGQKYNISTDNVEVTKINSVYREVLTGKTNYKFDVEATNNDDATMNTTYTIEYRPRNGQKVVREWRYHINYQTQDTEQEVDSSYVICSEQEILNNTVILNLLKYGVAYSFEKASEKYGVSNDNIVVTKINSVEKQQLKDKANYRFSVEANNNDETYMKTNFTIEYRPKTEKKIVRKWWYHIDYKDTDDEVKEENEDEVINVEECVLLEEEQDFCEIAEEGQVDVNEEEALVVDVDVDVEIEVDVDIETSVDDSGDYQQLTEQQIQNNVLVNQLLDFGLQYCFDKAAQKYGVADDDLDVTQINSVYRQQLKNNKVNYKFDIAATNNDDATMKATFTIEYNSISQEKIVREWSYKINYQTQNNNN